MKLNGRQVVAVDFEEPEKDAATFTKENTHVLWV